MTPWLLAVSMLQIAPAVGAPVYEIQTETLRSSAHPLNSKGRLIGCGIAFAALLHDKRAPKREPIGLSGTMTYLDSPGIYGIALRLVTNDMSAKKGKVTLTPIALASVGLVGSDGQSNAESAFTRLPSSEAGTTILAFKTDARAAKVIERITREDRLVLRFAREPDGEQIQADIDLRVADSGKGKKLGSTATAGEFAACAIALPDPTTPQPPGAH